MIADSLVQALQNESADKATAIETFANNYHVILEGKHPNIKNAVLAVTTTAVVTVLAGLVGFGIGFAAGIWTGPGAFIRVL